MFARIKKIELECKIKFLENELSDARNKMNNLMVSVKFKEAKIKDLMNILQQRDIEIQQIKSP